MLQSPEEGAASLSLQAPEHRIGESTSLRPQIDTALHLLCLSIAVSLQEEAAYSLSHGSNTLRHWP